MGSGSGSGSSSGSGSQGSGKVPASGSVPHVASLPTPEQLERGRELKQQIADDKQQALKREAEEKAKHFAQLTQHHEGLAKKWEQARQKDLAQIQVLISSKQYAQAIEAHAEYQLKYFPKDWSKWVSKGSLPVGSDKCNGFVCDIGNGAGTPVPANFTRGSLPPLAEHWADPSVVIPGWLVVTNPRPGDVAAVASWQELPGGAQIRTGGHVGIVVANNKTISHSSVAGDILARSDWGFRPSQQGQVVFRRYLGP